MNALDRRRLTISIVLALGTLAVFSQVFVCGLVNYDDAAYIGKPQVMRGLSASGIVWAFTGIHCSNWHPLTTISHMLDCSLFGQNPLGHHAVNLLIHIANVVLLFLLLERMTKSVWKSAFVAALFAIHPLHVESVAWIAERKDTLSTLFLILTMGAYVRYAEEPSKQRFRRVAILYALGLMSKPMLVTLPVALLLLDFWPLGRLRFDEKRKRREAWHGWPLVREKLPLFALAAVSCLITYYVQQKGGAEVALSQIPIGLRIENALVSYSAYALKILWPAKLSPFYPYPVHGIPVWKPLLSLLSLAAVTVFVFRNAKARGYLAFGWLWYLVTLVPVIGLVQVGEQAMADRYTYVPLIGLFVMVAWGSVGGRDRGSVGVWECGSMGEREEGKSELSESRIPPFARSPVLPVVCALVLAALAARTWVQVGCWKDRLTLFTHALEVTEGNYLAHDMVGAALNRQGKYQEAMKHFETALEIKPRDPFILMNLGNSLTRVNRLRDAVNAYDQAISTKPDFPLSHFNLAMALVLLGRDQEAVSEFNTVVALNKGPRGHPEMFTSDVQRNLRNADKLARLARSKPKDPYIRRRYALALADAGKLEEAIVQLSPGGVPRPRRERSSPSAMGSPDQRIQFYRQQLSWDPRDAKTHYGLGNALCDLKKRSQGIREYRVALRLKPDYIEAHNNLAVALYREGMYAEAWSEVRECRRLRAEPHAGFIKALSEKMPDPGP